MERRQLPHPPGAVQIKGNALIGRLAPCGIPATWGYVYFLKREGKPVLGMPFMWVFLPFVFLLLALVYRSAMAIWRAAKGKVPEKLGRRKFLLMVNLILLVLGYFLDVSVLLLVLCRCCSQRPSCCALSSCISVCW